MDTTSENRLDALLVSLSDVAYKGAGKDDTLWPDYDRIDMQITSEVNDLRAQLEIVTADRDRYQKALEAICDTKIWNGKRSWEDLAHLWLDIARDALKSTGHE